MLFSRRLALTSCKEPLGGTASLRGNDQRLVRIISASTMFRASSRLPENLMSLEIARIDRVQWFRKENFANFQLGHYGYHFELMYFKANIIFPLIDQPKEFAQIEQLGAACGARCVLTKQGRAAMEQEAAG